MIVIEPLPPFTYFINPGFGLAGLAGGEVNFPMITPKVMPGPPLVKLKSSKGSPPMLLPALVARRVVQAALVSAMSMSFAEPGAPLTEKKG